LTIGRQLMYAAAINCVMRLYFQLRFLGHKILMSREINNFEADFFHFKLFNSKK
jgi:hypothetical protein